MPIPGQPAASPPLREALDLLTRGQAEEAVAVVTRAARDAKKASGSGSHPLARAYADMARLHYRAGKYVKAATEFQHACSYPMPPDTPGRRDRLAFMFGYGACLDALGKPGEAEKVYRQCVTFAQNLFGSDTLGHAAATEPLSALLVRAGRAAEAVELTEKAWPVLLRHNDPAAAVLVATRAEALKAAGRTEDPFADLARLPDAVAVDAVTNVIERCKAGDATRTRTVLADLLRAVDRRFGDGHPAVADTLAAINRHEAGLGANGDSRVRATAARRAVWSHAVRRDPAGLLKNIEVAFEPDGSLHLVPHLTRDPDPAEAAHLEAVLTEAVDDLYARAGRASDAA